MSEQMSPEVTSDDKLWSALGYVIPLIAIIVLSLLWLVSFWPAYDAYKGNYTELPVITNFIKKQGWV